MRVNKTHNHGTVHETPGVMIAPAALRTNPNDTGDDTTGLTLNWSASAPTTQSLMTVIDKDGSTKVFEHFKDSVRVYNRMLGSAPGVFSPVAGLDGTISPIGANLGSGATVWTGTGHPTDAFTGTGAVGDVYLRRDGSAGRADGSCGTTSGSAVVTDTSAVAGDKGRAVSGTNIPAGSYIVSVSAGVSFTMNQNASGTGTVTATMTANYYNVCVTAGTPGTWAGIA